jgi:hypothetical protein
MNRKWNTILIVSLVVILAGYLVIDMTMKRNKVPVNSARDESPGNEDVWEVVKTFKPDAGKLKAVTVSDNGNIILGGDSYIAAYNPALEPIWTLRTDHPVTSVTSYGDTIFASTMETILEVSGKGDLMAEWGPFEDKAIITSVSANKDYVVFADAGNRVVIVLDKSGNFRKIIGNTGEPFIVPSPYFDVAVAEDNIIYVSNPGNSRVDKRDLEGTLVGQFGDPGIEPDEFSGCCNPANFVIIPGGFITAEKGINRIKKLGENGEFIELVSSVNNFKPSIPLDIASHDGLTIYGANPADSRLYVFKEKQ